MGHTFVYERLQPDHQEAIPHLRLGRKIKIDTQSPEWNQWLTDRIQLIPGRET